jgi:hypothetical protein
VKEAKRRQCSVKRERGNLYGGGIIVRAHMSDVQIHVVQPGSRREEMKCGTRVVVREDAKSRVTVSRMATPRHRCRGGRAFGTKFGSLLEVEAHTLFHPDPVSLQTHIRRAILFPFGQRIIKRKKEGHTQASTFAPTCHNSYTPANQSC